MKLLRHASIGVKVGLILTVAALCLAAVAALGLSVTHDLSASLRALQSTTLPNLATATELQRRFGSVYATINQSLAWTGALNRSLSAAVTARASRFHGALNPYRDTALSASLGLRF